MYLYSNCQQLCCPSKIVFYPYKCCNFAVVSNNRKMQQNRVQNIKFEAFLIENIMISIDKTLLLIEKTPLLINKTLLSFDKTLPSIDKVLVSFDIILHSFDKTLMPIDKTLVSFNKIFPSFDKTLVSNDRAQFLIETEMVLFNSVFNQRIFKEQVIIYIQAIID